MSLLSDLFKAANTYASNAVEKHEKTYEYAQTMSDERLLDKIKNTDDISKKSAYIKAYKERH